MGCKTGDMESRSEHDMGVDVMKCERCGNKTGFNWGDASEVLCTNCFWKKEQEAFAQKNPSEQKQAQATKPKQVQKLNLD